jgi:hypothetical protein
MHDGVCLVSFSGGANRVWSFVSFWPLKKAEVAVRPTVYVKCRQQGVCVFDCARAVHGVRYRCNKKKRLASGLKLQYSSGQTDYINPKVC